LPPRSPAPRSRERAQRSSRRACHRCAASAAVPPVLEVPRIDPLNAAGVQNAIHIYLLS
jgi:hypothetical protein